MGRYIRNGLGILELYFLLTYLRLGPAIARFEDRRTKIVGWDWLNDDNDILPIYETSRFVNMPIDLFQNLYKLMRLCKFLSNRVK